MLWGHAAERPNTVFIAPQITSQCMTNTYHTYISFFFFFLSMSLSSVCVSVCVSHTHTQRRGGGVQRLWQQSVSSVNDLWRVSRCVSLGSFRFVSTALYLRAPFMGPQVWPPSPTDRREGGREGSYQIPPLPPWRGQWWKAHEHDGATL